MALTKPEKQAAWGARRQQRIKMLKEELAEFVPQ